VIEILDSGLRRNDGEDGNWGGDVGRDYDSPARCRCHPDIAAFGEPDCLNRDSLDYGMTPMKKKKDKEYRDNPQIK